MAKKRLTSRSVSETNSVILTFDQAYDYFLSAKKAEGLRKPTYTSYKEHFNSLKNWINEYHPTVKRIDQLSVKMVRLYINYLSLEETYKGKCKNGHK